MFWTSSNSPFVNHPASCCFNSSCRRESQRRCSSSDCCSPRCTSCISQHRSYYTTRSSSLLYQFDDSHGTTSSLRISRGGTSFGNSMTFLSAAADGCSSSSNGVVNTPSSTITSNDLSQYHLITSPNVPSQIMMWTCLLYIMRRLLKKKTNIMNFLSLSSTNNNVYNYIILPLLSSACCSIQLMVNAMFASVGCVGFNKILGPLRPIFVAWLLLTTQNYITQIILVEHQGLLSSIIRISSFVIVTWTMALLPELIHWRNRSRQKASASQSSSSLPTSTVNANQNQQLMEIHLTIPSMGCVACIQKVTNSLQQKSGESQFRIEEASSWLNSGDKKGGKAKVVVEVPSSQNPKEIAQTLAQSVQENGFRDCQVDTIQKL